MTAGCLDFVSGEWSKAPLRDGVLKTRSKLHSGTFSGVSGLACSWDRVR
jgi:hypothetical protein